MKQTNGINKSDIVTIISNKTSIKKNDVDRILSCFFETVINELSRGHYVKITGFGVFENAIYKWKMDIKYLNTISGFKNITRKKVDSIKITRYM